MTSTPSQLSGYRGERAMAPLQNAKALSCIALLDVQAAVSHDSSNTHSAAAGNKLLDLYLAAATVRLRDLFDQKFIPCKDKNGVEENKDIGMRITLFLCLLVMLCYVLFFNITVSRHDHE